jgi:hypothetical protein
MLKNKLAKAIGDPTITNRASLSAYVGDGNGHFYKYSMLGHIYLLIQVVIEEALRTLTTIDEVQKSRQLEEIITRKDIYDRIRCFPKEISSSRLSIAAKDSLIKFKTDYKHGSFVNLLEWRCNVTYLQHTYLTMPIPQDFKILINDDTAYQPLIHESMDRNRKLMSQHLKCLLCLSTDNRHGREKVFIDGIDDEIDEDRPALNSEIIDTTTDLDLPIFVSIDASLKDGIAISSISIIILDTR